MPRFIMTGLLALAFLVQILAAAAAGNVGDLQAMAGERIAVCSSQGVYYIYPDGRDAVPADHGKAGVAKSCVYCLPLLSGHALGATGIALSVPYGEPLIHSTPAVLPVLPVRHDGHADPRAPPAVAVPG